MTALEFSFTDVPEAAGSSSVYDAPARGTAASAATISRAAGRP